MTGIKNILIDNLKFTKFRLLHQNILITMCTIFFFFFFVIYNTKKKYVLLFSNTKKLISRKLKHNILTLNYHYLLLSIQQ